MDILTREITSKKLSENFFFDHRNYIEKSTWKQRAFFDQQSYVEKSMCKRHGFFDQQNYIKKVYGNDVGIRRNLVFDVSTKYRRQIDINSTWSSRWEATF